MFSLHLWRCACHGEMHLRSAHEQLESIDNLLVNVPSFPMAHVKNVAYRQTDATADDFEHVYESMERGPSLELQNVPYSPQASSTMGVMAISHITPPPGPPLTPRCFCGLCGGPIVPQRPYALAQVPPNIFQQNPETLSFSKGGCGVRVVDAVANRLSGLVGGDDLMFFDATVTTYSLRVEVGC